MSSVSGRYQYHPQTSVLEDMDTSNSRYYSSQNGINGGGGVNSMNGGGGGGGSSGYNFRTPAKSANTTNQFGASGINDNSNFDMLMDDSSYFNPDESLHIPVTPIKANTNPQQQPPTQNGSAAASTIGSRFTNNNTSNSQNNNRPQTQPPPPPQQQQQQQPQPQYYQPTTATSTSANPTNLSRPNTQQQTQLPRPNQQQQPQQQTQPRRDEFTYSTYQDNFARDAQNVVDSMKQSTMRRRDQDFTYENQQTQQTQPQIQPQTQYNYNSPAAETPNIGIYSKSYVKNLEDDIKKLTDQLKMNSLNGISSSSSGVSVSPVTPNSGSFVGNSANTTVNSSNASQQPTHQSQLNQQQHQQQPLQQQQKTHQQQQPTSTTSQFSTPSFKSRMNSQINNTPGRSTVNDLTLMELTEKYSDSMSLYKEAKASLNIKENELAILTKTYQDVLKNYDTERNMKESFQKERDQLSLKWAEIQQANLRLAEDHNRLVDDIHLIEDQKHQAEQRFNETHAAFIQLQNDLATRDQQMANLRKDYDSCYSMLQHSKEKERRFNDEMAEVQHTLNEVKQRTDKEKTELEQQCQHLQKQLELANQEASNSKRQLNVDMDRLKSTITQNESIARELKELRQKSVQDQQSLQAKDQYILQLQQLVKKKDADFQRKDQENYNIYNQNLARVEQDYKMKLQEQREEFEQTISQMKKRINNQQQQISQVQTTQTQAQGQGQGQPQTQTTRLNPAGSTTSGTTGGSQTVSTTRPPIAPGSTTTAPSTSTSTTTTIPTTSTTPRLVRRQPTNPQTSTSTSTPITFTPLYSSTSR